MHELYTRPMTYDFMQQIAYSSIDNIVRIKNNAKNKNVQTESSERKNEIYDFMVLIAVCWAK